MNQSLAILASLASRSGRDSTLHTFLREYGRHLSGYTLHATKGTYETLLRSGLIDPSKLEQHRSGRDGGVVQIAQLAADRQLDAVALLLDPIDPLAESPENLALQRVCIDKAIPQLMNLGDLTHWIEYEAGDGTEERDAAVAEGDEVVALVSHDGKKAEMLDFVAHQASWLLAKHREIIATGTTGRLILELLRGASYEQLENAIGPERWKNLGDKRPQREPWEAYLEQLARSGAEGWTVSDTEKYVWSLTRGNHAVRFQAFESGPDGGDIRIAGKVIDKQCNAIIFFHDSKVPHAHDVDIRLCVRACQLPGMRVTLRRDRQSADAWAAACQRGRRKGIRPIILSRSPNRLPDRILGTRGDRDARQPEGSEKNEQRARELARVAAGYLDELLRELLVNSRTPARIDRVLLLVAWGTMLRWIAENLADDSQIARGKYGSRLTVAPMMGVTGEEARWANEANTIAAAIAGAYGATKLSVSSPAFCCKDEKIGLPWKCFNSGS